VTVSNRLRIHYRDFKVHIHCKLSINQECKMASSVAPAALFKGYTCICLPRALRTSPLPSLPAYCRVYGRFHTTNETAARICHNHISSSAAREEASFVSTRPRPEVLSPAGGWHQLYAAVENGADAVYFGLTHFNARARASNFSPEELPEVMGYLHARGVKGYLVMNVLVFDKELEMIARYAQAAAAAGVDAVICQDIGVIRLIKAVIPRNGLPVHGSTQMTITSAPGALFVKQRLGVDRVVLGRELSIKEIEAVATQCASSPMGPELEVFVHGALCVSYSGQCFSSEAWGGRSANRGQCAQACRLGYGLLVDGTLRDLGDVQYLLSPQDLAALDYVSQLMPLVKSFKIEGRLKGPEYVAMTTKAYRDAVDKAVEGPLKVEKETWRDLAQVFARGQDGDHLGLTPGFLQGPQHQKLVRGRAPRHRGVFLGKVTSLEFDRPTKLQSALIASTKIFVEVDLVNPLRRGDGIVVDIDVSDGSGDSRVSQEIGGFVQKIYCSKEVRGLRGEVQEAQGEGRVRIEVRLAGPIDVMDGEVANKGIHFKTKNKKKINESKLLRDGGMLLWKTKDPALEAKLKSTYLNLPSTAKRRIPVRVRLEASLGQTLRIYIIEEREDGNLQSLEPAETDVVAVKALSRPLSPKDLEAAVGTYLEHGEVGGGLVVKSWDHSGVEYDQDLFLPVASIKDARRRGVDQFFRTKGLVTRAPKDVAMDTWNDSFSFNLQDYIVDPHVDDDSTEGGLSRLRKLPNFRSNSEPLLRVLCRTKAQVDAAVTIPWLEEIIVDFLEVHGLRSACDTVKAAGKRLVVATPRIVKPDEDSMFMNLYTRLGADAILVRSLGLLQLLLGASGHEGSLGVDLEGDFSLNAANSLSADALLGMGLDRIALTHDCNVSQLTEVARALGDLRAFNSLEVIIHQNLPVFHTEHCVFARFLSSGNSYLDCGKPCERHRVHLRDGKGIDHLVLADMGCRNTVFEGRAQSGLHYIGALAASGFGCFRVELVDQPASVVVPLLQGYRQALLGHASPTRRRGQTEEGIIDTDFSSSFWKWLEYMPDSNGRTHGVGGGSLEPYAEREVEHLKPTAASLKAVQPQHYNVFSHQERGDRRKG
jgi:putative protease